MLRAMITGVNGESIGPNKKETFFEKAFTFDIPEKINDVDVVLKDLTILAFITEHTPEQAATLQPRVINVCKSNIIIK